MTCDQVRERLVSYPMSPLSAEERRSIDEHTSRCADCRADYQAASIVGARVAGLDRDIQPPSDLWTGIAPRLRAYRGRIEQPLWRMAAAAVLLIAVSSTVTWMLMKAPAREARATFQSLEADYARSTLELTTLYAATRSTMTPATRAVVERNLAVIERALGEAREALRGDPLNSALEAIVATAYRRKIEFLERATTLDRES